MFYSVATEGGFSKAARKLFISQSAVSQSISQLEENIGARLFIRLARGIRLTKEGEILLEHVSPALEKIRTAEKRLEDMSGLESVKLTVSDYDTFCMNLYTGLLEIFIKSNTGILINIANKNS